MVVHPAQPPPGRPARFDWAGLAIFVPAIAVLMGAVSSGDRLGWASPGIVASLAAGAVLGVAFVAREHHAGAPMLDLKLFHRPAFSTGVAGGLASYLVVFGVLVVTPFFLEQGLRVAPGRAGLELTVMPLFLALAAIFAGRLSDRSGGRALTVTGMVVVTTTLAVLATSKPGQAMLLFGLALVGTGLGLFTPANNAAIMASAPKERAGVAAGVLNMARGPRYRARARPDRSGLRPGTHAPGRLPGRNGALGRRLGRRPHAGRSTA